MKTIAKLFFLIIFVSVSAFASAQSFTMSELVDLASNGKEPFQKEVTTKGYDFQNTESNGLSEDLVYTRNNSKIMMISTSFGSNMKIVSWEFKSAAIYNDLKAELESSFYSLNDSENRNAGKYISLYYSGPDVEIILTVDKTVDRNGIYTASVQYMNDPDGM